MVTIKCLWLFTKLCLVSFAFMFFLFMVTATLLLNKEQQRQFGIWLGENTRKQIGLPK